MYAVDVNGAHMVESVRQDTEPETNMKPQDTEPETCVLPRILAAIT